MRLLSTKTHGYIDYIVGLLLIASPWLMGFARNEAETWILVFLGIGALVYSAFTNYELGVIRLMAMRTHLTLDFLSGLFLAASPWIFGFDDYIILPHVLFGLFEMAATVITERVPTTANSMQRNEPSPRL